MIPVQDNFRGMYVLDGHKKINKRSRAKMETNLCKQKAVLKFFRVIFEISSYK